MDSIKEAFLKAGLINNEDIEHINNNKKSVKTYRNIPKLDKEEYKIFNKMIQINKSRKFLLHLVHAFLPNLEENNVDYIWSWKDVKGERKCAICDQLIISISDAYIKAKNNIDEKFIRTTVFTNDNSSEIFNITNYKLDKILKDLFVGQEYFDAFHNKVAGIHSKNSTSFICAPCYKLMNDWILYMLLVGNRNINYIIGDKIKKY